MVVEGWLKWKGAMSGVATKGTVRVRKGRRYDTRSIEVSDEEEDVRYLMRSGPAKDLSVRRS